MKITVTEFVKRVNALKSGEHISVQLVEDGYIVTAFATEVKGNRYHFLMVEGFYGYCEQGFEGFDEQDVYEYLDYAKNLATDTQELDEIEELIVVDEYRRNEEKKKLIQQIWDVLNHFGEDGSWCIDGVELPDGSKIEYVSIEPDGGVSYHAYDENGMCDECGDLNNLEVPLLKEILKELPC